LTDKSECVRRNYMKAEKSNAQTTRPHLTGALEDYLETIFLLVREHRFARVRDIAKARNVKAGSVSPALKRLAELGLVNYVRREYVGLTDDGEREARRVLARHDLLTNFFAKVLKMPARAAEREACAMEHSLSNEGMDRLVRFFEFFSVCPDGPSKLLERFQHCSLVHEDVHTCEFECATRISRTARKGGKAMSVYDLKPGQQGRVSQVTAQGAIRQRLLDMGILPEVVVRMERVAPAGDPVWINLEGSQLALRRKEAESVLILGD